ncbi:MAG: AzlD domain-containing protein [Ruminiclostridium sp.]|nr:AzlD domain-containing protein [Ruminiclostridium sp.]
MDNGQFLIYLLIMSGSTYLIRAIPFAAVRRKIENTFIKSFLYYIPYTVLAAMTFPSALYATGNMASAAVGLLVAVIFAILEKDLTVVAIAACVSVYLTELIFSLTGVI